MWSIVVPPDGPNEVDWWSFGMILQHFSLGREPFEYISGKCPPTLLKTSDLKGADPLLVSILNATIGLGYISLKMPEARLAMESPLPEAHPILSNDFWLTGTEANRTQALREYWAGICQSHAADPQAQCAQLFKEKSAVKPNGWTCVDTAVAKCCCRRSACLRKNGRIFGRGVDELPVLEFRRGKTTVCCARQAECGGEFPHLNITFGGGASCYESSTKQEQEEKAKLAKKTILSLGASPAGESTPAQQ